MNVCMMIVAFCAVVCAHGVTSSHTQRVLPWARLDAARKQELGRKLWDASATGSVAEVVELLDAGIQPDHYRSTSRWTALMQASIRSDHSARDRIAAALIAHNADVNAADLDGWTSLHSLAMLGGGGSLTMVQLLVAHGANIHRRDASGLSPLDLATHKGDATFVRFANACADAASGR